MRLLFFSFSDHGLEERSEIYKDQMFIKYLLVNSCVKANGKYHN